MIETREYNEQYKDWRKSVLNRDGRKCVKCGSKQQIQVHHKKTWADYPELRYDQNNGEVVCLSCHIIIHPFMVKYLKKSAKKKLNKKSSKIKEFKKSLKRKKNKRKKNKRNKNIAWYKDYKFSRNNPNPNWTS